MTSLIPSSINSTSLATTTGGILINQTGVPLTSETASIAPLMIVAVSFIIITSSVAVVMNSGILVLTYWLKLINKDYRMIYYVLITATDLTFSIYSIINCMTIIFRNFEFFKYKLFCLILQCSGTVSYQVTAMTIILLISDLVYSIRDPFSTMRSPLERVRVTYVACFVAILIAMSSSYGPFIWWYGNETKLDSCSLANLYGSYFTDYNKIVTVVLASLSVLMVIASSLLLKEIKSSIDPNRLKSLKVPSIIRHDPESQMQRKLEYGRRNALHDNKITDDQVTQSERQLDQLVDGSAVPNVISDVAKVPTSLYNCVGVDNKEEDISMRNKLQNIDSNLDMGTCPNVEATINEKLDRKDSNASHSRYTDPYTPGACMESEMPLSATYSRKTEQQQNAGENAPKVNQKHAFINQGFDGEEIQNITTNEMKGTESTTNTASEATSTTGEIHYTKGEDQQLTIDLGTAYRGSIEKVRRITGTERIGPEIKETLNNRSKKKKRNKFLRACKTVAAFVTAYLVCSMPYCILSVVELAQGTATEVSVQQRYVRMICSIFANMLSVIDPILYTSRFGIIRQTLRKIIPRCCRCSKHSDD